MAVPENRSRLLADSGLRRSLARYVRARVRASEVDDVVQTTLADALAAATAPESADDLERWIRGIARHKIADLYRGRRHESPPQSDHSDIAVEDRAPHSARDLLRWATRELPDVASDQHTLEWMLREGAGEKLEEIAQEQGIPAARVRQRVSRLRRFLRQRWAAQLAAVAGVVLVAGVAYWVSRDVPEVPRVARELPQPNPAQNLRKRALGACDRRAYPQCIALLDEAKSLDPAGESLAEVRAARAAASEALAPHPAPLDVSPHKPSPFETAPLDTAPLDTAPLHTLPRDIAPPVPTESRLKQPAPKRTAPDNSARPPTRAPKYSSLPTQMDSDAKSDSPMTRPEPRKSASDELEAKKSKESKAPTQSLEFGSDSGANDGRQQKPPTPRPRQTMEVEPNVVEGVKSGSSAK